MERQGDGSLFLVVKLMLTIKEDYAEKNILILVSKPASSRILIRDIGGFSNGSIWDNITINEINTILIESIVTYHSLQSLI